MPKTIGIFYPDHIKMDRVRLVYWVLGWSTINIFICFFKKKKNITNFLGHLKIINKKKLGEKYVSFVIY